MKLLIAIPAWNEEKSISQVISDVHQFLPQAEVLVVDDGSTDQTAVIASRAGATVISMPFNVGVGGALRVAFKYALSNNFSHLMQIDADGQHLPSEAKQLLESASDNCVVVGSRFLNREGNYRASASRRFAMIVLAKITQLICRTPLTDVTSGFRMASGDAIKIFAREYPRDYLGDTVESLIIAHRLGIPIREVPVTMKKREHGTPSQNLIKSTWYLIRALLMITLAVFKKRNEKF
jgi:glycosyltransferase involved in cell wall biosynthesis